MFKNHIKLAWRNFKKNRLFSTINLLGLSLGLLACISVTSVVIDDFSYDSHWSRKDDIHRVLTKIEMGDGVYDKISSSWAGLQPALAENFPEVEAVTSIYNIEYHIKRNLEENTTINIKSLETDSLVWDVLDLKIIAGTPKNFVYGQSNIVLTKTLKNKLYPNEDPIGKTIYSISSYGEKPSPFLITGIIEDIPNNTHLRSEALVINKVRVEPLYEGQYGSFSQNYAIFKSGTDIKAFADKLNTWYSAFVGGTTKYSYEFQPIEETYLNSEFDSGLDIKGNRSTDYILLSIALLLLVIACLNFINLTVARSLTRVQEIGVRKVLGAPRRQIINQFLTESLLYFAIASLVTLPAFYLALPFIEDFLGHALQLSFVTGAKYLSIAFITVFGVATITGMYPALLISGFKPVNSLKGTILSSQINGQQTIQKGLVVVQFSIAIVVLVSVLVVRSQLNYMSDKDLGYDKENLLTINTVSWNGKAKTFYNELVNLPSVTATSLASWVPTKGSGNMFKTVSNPNSPDTEMNVYYIKGDIHLAETLGLELVSGRLFDEQLVTDALPVQAEIRFDDQEKSINSQPSLLTEYTAGILGVTTMDKIISEVETNPVGILKNFHTESLRDDLKPVVIIAESNPKYSSALIRVKEGSSAQAMIDINTIWKEMFPNKLLDTSWVDDLVAQQYLEERKMQQFFTFFSFFSLLLAAMGIFGLVAQSTQQRVKEIGIRKVLGASVGSIALLFSKDYVKLVAIAIIISLPIAWYGTSKWLQDFAYRITVDWPLLSIAAISIMALALITVAIQSVRAAISNPIQSLKTE